MTRRDKPGLNTDMKKSSQGYRSSIRLQQQLAHLEELLQQTQEDSDQAYACHMVSG
jgi:hypothetical protein